MKLDLSRGDTQKIITVFFERQDFQPDEVRKILRLAMKHRIRLGKLRQRFCKKCLRPLRGTTRISKTLRTVVCQECGHVNRHVIR